ncbi:putative signal peptide-containing protein [Cryptosporidium canis]|uniref:Signal peptide-containing protein n=1 Tax=Cryptosporidium canis TaxID=195482 RepID=A0ABQ8P5H8_9CRYT|nr:putative signal peptide-containing protein [Cryptosporidium canis]KAJ1613457.1 putative signal peptide-containing protein [Cryptosporidium canis]
MCLNIKLAILTIICLICISFGEQQSSASEFLQYFSNAAGINSLLFSLSNTICSIKKLNHMKQKNGGFNKGINESIERNKEYKSRNKVINNHAEINNTNILGILIEEIGKKEINITNLIAQTNNLTEIVMVENDAIIGGVNTKASEENFKDFVLHFNQLFSSNDQIAENLNNTFLSNVNTITNISRNFRGVTIE